jgi:hypothetical protein
MFFFLLLEFGELSLSSLNQDYKIKKINFYIKIKF